MWKNFEGIARSREDTLARIKTLNWIDWKPQGITLHNTAAPNLKQWAELGPAHDARIRNLESYYENELGWHAGPHWFVSRSWINWFSDPLHSGVHSRCWNSTRFGIEMVGDFNAEEFNGGDGALVRDNAVFLIAALNNKFGFKAEDLTFHKECKLDNHDCPGKNVVKADVIARVRTEMDRQKGVVAPPAVSHVEPAPPQSAPSTQPVARDVLFQTHGRMSTFGGPRDRGMSPTEGLALFTSETEMQRHGLGGYLLSSGEAGASGLGRRLITSKFYLACRWSTHDYPLLRDAVAHVANPKTDKIELARPMDWGPNANTGRVADLSPGLAAALGLDTDDQCTVTVYRDGK